MQFLQKCCGGSKHDAKTHRERWDSRKAFILAASGSAIGLGNLWRFPALSFKHGGGAFFLPYLLALFLIGIPLAILELALGQVVQSGDIACFGSMHRRLRGIGLGSVFGSFMVVCYYNVIVTWSVIYLVSSFGNLPWDIAEGVTGEQMFEPGSSFLNNDVLQLGDLASSADRIVGREFGFLLFVWVAIAAIVWRGVSSTSKVVYVTMIVPLITIIILLVRGVTLDGSMDGIMMYIGGWDMAVLANGVVWSEAVGQIFFSIGVTFGIMTAYSSYNSRFQNTVQDALIISLTNSAVSIVAGFAVFSVLGHLSKLSGVAIEDMGFGGLSLAFMTYPVALAQMPLATLFSVLFFLTLFFLGIDSAFSMVEAVTTAIKDSRTYHKISRGVITGSVVVAGFLVGCIYITNLGLYFLDVVDAYVSNVGMLFIGFMECFSAGWIYKIDVHKFLVGAPAVNTLMLAWIGGTLAGCIVAHLWTNWIGAVIGGGAVLIGSFLAYSMARDSEPDAGASVQTPERTKFWNLFCFPVEALRSDLNAVIKQDGDGYEGKTKWAIPWFWGALIRYFIPPVLIIMESLTIQAYATQGGYLAGPDTPYPLKYQLAGLISSGLILLLVIVPIFRPSLLDGFIPEKDSGAHNLGALVIAGTTPADFNTTFDYEASIHSATDSEENPDSRGSDVMDEVDPTTPRPTETPSTTTTPHGPNVEMATMEAGERSINIVVSGESSAQERNAVISM